MKRHEAALGVQEGVANLCHIARSLAEAADEAANSHNAALAARRLEDRARRSGVTRMTGLTGVQIGDGGTQNNVF